MLNKKKRTLEEQIWEEEKHKK